MADPRIKALKIKTGVVKRLTKEKLMYIKETEQQREKVEKLKESGELNDNNFNKLLVLYMDLLNIIPHKYSILYVYSISRIFYINIKCYYYYQIAEKNP